MENKSCNYIESDIKILELDGQIFRIKKIFAPVGSTILDGVVSMLLDMMEQHNEKEI